MSFSSPMKVHPQHFARFLDAVHQLLCREDHKVLETEAGEHEHKQALTSVQARRNPTPWPVLPLPPDSQALPQGEIFEIFGSKLKEFCVLVVGLWIPDEAPMLAACSTGASRIFQVQL